MTKTRRTFVAALVLALAASASGLAKEQQRLRAQVHPSFAQAPALVRIQAMVEPADDNRALEIVADSGGYYRSSMIELSGATAARTYIVEFRGVPEGVYQVL